MRNRGRLLACLAAGIVAGMAVLTALLKHAPSLIAAAPLGPDADRAAARLVTKASALHAAIGRDGSWDAGFGDAELNAWLATDLPRNHATLLPRGITEPRVRFRPHHVETAVRLGSGVLSTVIWCDLDVTLRSGNQLRIELESATAGALPLPRTPVLAELGRRITACGVATELRPVDGRMGLVVYIPSQSGGAGPNWRLESLRIDDGEAFLAGTTRVPPGDRTKD